MILAEKVALLRKKKGWSQEELAEKLGISRQSVSKWESAASIPDIDKIILLSQIFQVSTDYLLKDEMEETDKMAPAGEMPEKPERRTVSVEEANGFMGLTRKLAAPMAFAVMLFVLCPIPLILTAGMAETGRLSITEDMAGGIGVVILLVIVAVGVTILVLCGVRMEQYGYLEKEIFTLQYGVEGIARKNKELFTRKFSVCVAAGTALCILGAVPLLLYASVGKDEFILLCCVALLLVLVAVAVFLFVWAGLIQDSFKKLLQAEEFSPEQKSAARKLGAFSGAYWCTVVIIFLVVFAREKWLVFDGEPKFPGILFGMIWVVAALLYAVIRIILNAVIERNKNREV